MDSASVEGIGLYIHWPYCAAKCPYCDFNSYARQTLSEAAYLAACKTELIYYAGLTKGRAIASIFFGGGTPSLMSAAAVSGLLDHAASLWAIAPGAEITLEANPSSVEAARFAGYRAAGVNRVSIGVQSLQDEALKFLGRLHNRDEALAALAVAKKHFERVSFDLIYARPHQSRQAWAAELREALSLSCGHLSLYQLTIEPGTAFFDLERAGKLRVPEGARAAELYEMTGALCEAAGLPAYEISNHARPGEESRHNLIYWRYGDYIGAGPGAHGRLTLGESRAALAAIRDPKGWAEAVAAHGHGVAERVALSRREQAVEMLLMGLRLKEGLDLAAMRRETGYSVGAAVIQELERDGLASLSRGARHLAATREGALLLNAVIAQCESRLVEQPEGQAARPAA